MKKNLGIDLIKRTLTLKTHKIHSLPIAILMPHSSCNCRCVMCDIWQGNANQQRLTADDVDQLLASFKQLGTKWVVMSGGEALMNPNLFQFCELLQKNGLKVSILSTGLLLKKYATQVIQHTDEVIVSLDGSPAVHDAIRRIPKAFAKLAEGVGAVKAIDPTFRITGRCVIQRLNFADWGNIVRSAQEIGLDEISFLPADVTSEAFNRPELWEEVRQEEIRLRPSELPQLKQVLTDLVRDFAPEFESGYIAESPEKLWRVYDYYGAFYGETAFPAVKCNAPWVSAVVEADGTVRPCYFHDPIGNVREEKLPAILNSPSAIKFRQTLDLDNNDICRKCVCTLNLRPTVAVG